MAKILGVKIDNYSFVEVMQKIARFLSEDKIHQIVTVNPEFIIDAQKDTMFRDIINKSDLSIPDGIGLQFGAKILNQRIGQRLTGVDLTWELAKLASEKGYSIYFLGAQEGIAKKAALRIKKLYPNLKIAGTYAGSPNEKGIVERILKTKPNILLVAFGAPKQEKFIHNLKKMSPHFSSRISNFPKIAVGVGGTFDYIAGVFPRAPKWLRNLGLEWLYRLFTQPKRTNRIFNAVIYFPILVLIYKIKKMF